MPVSTGKLKLIFVSAAVLLMVALQVFLTHSFSSMDDLSNKINLVASQRMRAHELREMAESLSKDPAAERELAHQFQADFQKWEAAQKALTHGSELYQVDPLTSADVLEAMPDASASFISLHDQLALRTTDLPDSGAVLQSELKPLITNFNTQMARVQALLTAEKDSQVTRSEWFGFLLGFGAFALLMVSLFLGVLPIFRKNNTDNKLLQDQIAEFRTERSHRAELNESIALELRSPIQVIRHLAQTLRRSDLQPEQQKWAKNITSGVDYLDRMLHDLLSRQKSSAETSIQESFELQELCETVEEMMKPIVNQKHNELLTDLDSNLPATMIQDEPRVTQILCTLIDFLNRQSERTELILRMELLSREAQFAQIQFTITSGKSFVSQDFLDRHFNQAAYTVPAEASNKVSPGLLAASKSVMDLGGRIWAETSRAGDCTMHFTLVGELDPTSVKQKVRALEGYKALVVDSNKTSLKTLVRQLSGLGIQATPFTSADLAAEVIGSLRHFDFCLLDLQNREMKPQDLAKRLSGQGSGKPMPVIALTNSTDPLLNGSDDIFSAVLAKPVRQSQLVDSIIHALGLSNSEIARRAIRVANFAGNTSLSQLKVLIAQDNPLHRAVTNKTLELLGCTYENVNTGDQVITKLSEQEYDLILMDTRLPKMDGLQAAKKIKSTYGSRKSPVIIGITENEDSDRNSCLNAGMDDCISRPVRSEEIEEKIHHWFEESEDRDI